MFSVDALLLISSLQNDMIDPFFIERHSKSHSSIKFPQKTRTSPMSQNLPYLNTVKRLVSVEIVTKAKLTNDLVSMLSGSQQCY